MILENVELNWVKIDPENLDMGFDKQSPQYSVQVATRDKKQSDEWKKAGLNPKTDSDDTGIFYKLSVKKPAVKKDGSEAKPVPCIGGDLMPLEDPTSIGNGSIGNVKVRTFEYNFNGREGVGVRLDAIQVTKLVEYKSSGSSKQFEGFSKTAADDTSMDDVNPFAPE